jgi:NAD(P)-dependent dehydrogenase (short-subunit alcohol dehydrogenase family)
MIQLNTVAVIEGTYIACELIAQDAATKAQGAVIVNTASLAGIHPIPSTPAYTASKHAVVGFTRACGNLIDSHNTRVVALCPALVETPDVGTFFKVSLLLHLHRRLYIYTIHIYIIYIYTIIYMYIIK